MAISEYWAVLRRRAWIVGIVFGVVVLASIGLLIRSPRSGLGGAQVTTILAVQAGSKPATGDYYAYDGFYPYQVAGFVAEDLALMIQSPDFLDVLAAQNPSIAVDAATSAITATRAQRALTVTVTSSTPQAAQAISEAMVSAITSESGGMSAYLSGIPSSATSVAVVVPPSASQAAAGVSRTRLALDLGLRCLLGLLAGIGLAFLFDYLDDRLWGVAGVERALGLPVLGVVPTSTSASARRSDR